MRISLGLSVLLLSGAFASADSSVDQLHQVNIDASAMTRALDVLAAREEMKADAAIFPVRFAELMGKTAAASETDHKVDLLTDPGSLDKCQKKFSETGENTNPRIMHIEYSGAQCPVSVTGDTSIKKTSQSDLDVTFNIKVQILSPELRQQFDIDEIDIPGEGHVKAVTEGGGFGVDAKVTMTAAIHSLKLGQVSYTADLDMNMVMNSQGMQLTAVTNETYKAPSLSRVFRQESSGTMAGTTEKFSIDGKPVTKEEFTKEHETLQIPGFSQDHLPLHNPVTCQVRSYDANAMTLQALRDAIKNGTADKLTPVESFGPTALTETGKVQTMFNHNAWQMEVQTTVDVVRIEFTANATQQAAGTVTGILAEKFDLAKTVGNLHIRLNCAPK